MPPAGALLEPNGGRRSRFYSTGSGVIRMSYTRMRSERSSNQPWTMPGMNAQEHHLEAERLLGLHRPAHEPSGPPGDTNIARAQVHATLALAAATARTNGSPLDETRESSILDRWRHEGDR